MSGRGTEAGFVKRVEVRGPDECWPWTGHCTKGRAQYGDETAARFAWRIWRSEIPQGALVVHTCVRIDCVNPAHLAIGTARDRKKPEPKPVVCGQCGAKCLCGSNVRPDHYRCTACQELARVQGQMRIRKALRVHARRYRIILHVLGWEDAQFTEMLAEMKDSPSAFRRIPEGQAAGRDVAADARYRKRTKDTERRLLGAYADGVTMEDLEDRFGIDPDVINQIASRAGVARPSWFGGKRGAA